MLSTGVFETRRAKVIASVLAVLLLAAFQSAVQAKPAHAYEVHLSISGAGTVDEDPALTQADLLNPACSSSSTTPTNSVGANCYPGDPNGNYAWGWVVRWKATPAPGYTFARWESDGSPKPVICDGATNGSSTYTGSSCQFATYDNLQTRAVFVDNTNPTIASLSGPVGTVGGSTNFSFSATSDPTFWYFECRVAGVHDWQTCTSPKSENPAASGTYTFDVRAVDYSGNKSSVSSWTWTVDKTPPTVNITSGPQPSSFSNVSSPSFSFSSSELSTFQCSLDSSVSFSSCSSPRSYSGLSDGQHTFYVRAIDNVGNMGSATSRTWTIDTAPPETTMASDVGPAPDSTTPGNDPVFAFTSSEDPSSFECNLQGPGFTSTAFTACPSPKGYTNLTDGNYTFSVRAKDPASNVDASPAQRTWTILNRPTVLTNSLTPLKGATGVLRTTDVSTTFSEPMAPTSITNSTTHVSKTFKLQQWNPTMKVWKAVPATVILSNSDQTATLDPYGATEGATEKALAASTKFKATITTGAEDASGNPMAKTFTWTFTTGRR